jgi:uncharacterized damage-inducible protein DinB
MTSDQQPPRWTKATVYADMWLDPDDDPREAPAPGSDERSELVDFLRRYRLTLELKCADLDAEQLAARSVPPSSMSLLGMVRHLADVERHWFRRIMSHQGVEEVPPLFWSDEDDDGDWNGAVAEAAVVEDAWRAWRAEVTFAEKLVADAPDLDLLGRRDKTLRWVLIHMIEEYARHCGHADLLRERIDGRVGQ